MRMGKSYSEPVLLGRLGRAWGLRGEMVFRPESDGGLPFHRQLTTLIVEGVDETLEAEGWRIDGSGRLYVRLAGIDTPEKARVLSGRPVYISPARLPETEEGVWYVYQLVGLNVLYTDGTEVGRVVDVEPGVGGANDVLVVETPDGGECLYPFIERVVVSVDIEGGKVVLLRTGEEEVPP
jgi:16S rRNA processing protein RimM